MIYNEIDAFPAAWLRNMIAAGHLPRGDVLECSIKDLKPEDVRGRDFHAFAGIGVWAYALRQAGWTEPVWTGSCPCQPFSSAGRGAGFDDERHLWPVWFELIRACRPPVIFGEQVASKDGLAWLDLVHADLEGENYSVRAVDLCAAGFGAPHVRQRLYFVAYTDEGRRGTQLRDVRAWKSDDGGRGSDGWMGDDSSSRRGRAWGSGEEELQGEVSEEPGRSGTVDGLGDAGGARGGRDAGALPGAEEDRRSDGCLADVPQPASTNGFWRDAEWIPCSDGKFRPVEPGTFPLAHGAPARVGRLRAYGNAIVAPQAIEFIRAAKECLYGS